MEKFQTFHLDGIQVKIKFTFDSETNMYIGDYPDFEETPLYSQNGHPVVTSVRDNCPHHSSGGKFADCGSCKFFTPESKNDLIGFCSNEALKKQF